MRLIDAEALLKTGIRAKHGLNEDGLLYIPLRDVTESIKNTPTVEAVEEVHGRWAWITGDIHRCTNCGCTNHVKTVMGLPDWNYCPNCGADMRERKDND